MSKAVITFGRMNPPTVGHQKVVDKVKAEATKQGATPYVYLSHSQDKKKNPLDYNTKLTSARKAFGSSVTRSRARTIIEVMVELQKKHKEVTVIAGSDRVREFRTLLNKYNGKDFKFDKITVKSAGARDPDAEGASGMSATKMRTAAQSGDYDSFKKGVPTALSDRDIKAMYNKIRSEMGVVKEEIEWTEEDFEFTDAELDAAVDMIDFDALDEDTEIDEEFADYLEEARKPLTIAQRMKIGRRMKRLAPRMARMRKIRSKRMADPKRLEGRARKAAIKILRKRFAGKQGQNYAKLSPGSKMSVDRIIQKKAGVIPTLARRLLPKMRKREMERLKRARGGGAPKGGTTAAKTLVQGDHVEPHVPILYEEEVDSKLMALLRVTFPDTTERNLVIRALRGGSKSLQNPTLRPYLMNILLRLLDGVQDDPSIYNKVKEKMRRLGLEEKQDPDIKDREGSQPASYHSGLKKSTKVARDRHFKKYAEKPGQDKKDSDSNYKPAPGDAKGKTKLSKHTKKYRAMYGEDINTYFEELFLEEEVLHEKQIAGLVKKAEKSGIPYGILKQVYNRGMAAWKSGHRPGATPQQWAFARVNSFITKGKGTWGKADKDLAAKVRGSKPKKEELEVALEAFVDEGEKWKKEFRKIYQSLVRKGMKPEKAAIAAYDSLKKFKEQVDEDAVKAAKDKISREKEADKAKHDAMLDRARLQKAQNKNRATEENENEIEVDGYQTKNFHMCGSAQKVMKKLAGKEGAKELTQMQDKFYGLEKQIMQDGAASKEQKATARMMHDKIMARAKQVGLDDEIGEYMKMHIDSIEKGDPKLGFGRTDINEVLGKDATIGDYVKDFQKSDAPQFKGKSKEKRQKMAVAAYLDKKDKNESIDDQFESLWANIHKKRKEGRPMRKKGEKGAPTDDAFRRAKNEEYGAGEEGTDGLVKKYKEDTPGEDCTCFDHVISEAEYQGRKVKLNDPMRSNDGKKKFYVYTKNEKGNIVKVGFGDPNMEIKRDDPGRRKNFRARHNCDNPGPKWKARYWSCYQWRAGAKVDN
tara:strand:- start:975 stop:4088 length:3114 start_codon:yes stop_codon:yes gene_type:complete